MTAPLISGDPPQDGRHARRHRTRDLAVDAVLDLLAEGVLRPTAQQVADRSGVSLRSIFRIFDDVETLRAAAAARQVTRVRHLYVDVVPTGPLEGRVHEVVTISSRLYEQIAPIRRAALRLAPESEALREQLARARAWLRSEVERVFASEVAASGASDLIEALELALSFEAWDRLRTAQGLSASRSAAVIERTIDALLRPS